jgi:hypothetical protein
MVVNKPQRRKVVVHIRSEQDRINNSGIFHGLKVFNIEHTVVTDTAKFANRKYPYIELDGRIICIKRLIRAKQEGNL